MLQSYKKLANDEGHEGGASQASLVQPSMAQSSQAQASVVRTSPVDEIELKDEKMDAEHLKRIKWSQKSLSLSAFVDKYPLPQIVQVEEGYYGGRDDNSLSAGQVLKIHLLSSERKILCIDRHEKEVHIPLFTKQRVILRPVDYDVVYQTVAELAKQKPLPPFVEVTRGYYNVNSNVKYELSVEPGEKLRVLHDDSGGVSKADKKIKHMSFQNRDGVDIKIPYDCVAGFKPLLHLEPQNLADVVASNPFPFRIEFVPDSSLEVSDGPGISHHKLGVLECTELYDEELIIASCGYDKLRVVFTIPRNLKVTVKLAIGTLNTDPEYDLIRRSYHNFANLEENVARERSSKFFRSSGEIEGFSLASAYKADVINSQLVAVPEDRIIQDDRISEPSRATEVSSQVQQDAFGVLKGEADSELATSKFVAKPTDVVNAGLSTSSSASVQSKSSPLPERIDELSVNQVAVCLRSLNMGKHEGKFRFNQIDGALLAVLDDDALKDLQLNSFERKKILSFVKGWRPHKE